MTLTASTVEALRELQQTCGDTAASKGFHDDRPTEFRYESESVYKSALRDWQSNKLMLIVSEAVEAHDEIRNGRAGAETYYPTKIGTGGWQKGQQMIAWCDTCGWGLSINQVEPALANGVRTPEGIARDHQQSLNRDDHEVQWARVHKPEGVPSEIADAVIRCFDFAYTEGFDLAGIIAEKLVYNASRERLHGKKF